MTDAKTIILTLIFIVFGLHSFAQKDSIVASTAIKQPDSVLIAKHKPSTAMLLSIIPGGGQIYNHKAWKIPIIYAGLGACGHFIYHYAAGMVGYRNEFINRRDGNTELLNPIYATTPTENLIQAKNTCMRNMEIAIGVAVIFYTLNIIDAMVDAHLYYFDISDDLSFRWAPSFVPSIATSRPSYGATISFTF